MMHKLAISENKKKLALYIILVAVTLVVYWQVNQFDFLDYDDSIYITKNNYVQSELSQGKLFWAFGTKYYHLWHPLVWLSFMVDYQIYGLHPGGYHVTNLILHILSTLLLFWLFCRMTNEIWKSAFVAALFALHPLHVESVAWIAERKDVLSAFFWMLTLCFYVYYTEKPVIKRYLLVLFAFVLALMSKPMVVTLPLIMMLLDYWPLKRFEAKKENLFLWQAKEKLPFFALLAGFLIIMFNAPQKQDAFLIDLPLMSRLAGAPIAFATYWANTFWPYDLAIFYPFPKHIPVWQVGGTTALIIIITAYVFVAVKSRPYLFVGWFWFMISILPVLGVMRIGDFALTDRYHYLPSTGIAVAVAWGIPSLFQNNVIRKKILFPATVIFLVILAVLTWKQCAYWKNDKTIWKHAVRVTRDNYVAHINLGSALVEKGENDKAAFHYEKAILINKIILKNAAEGQASSRYKNSLLMSRMSMDYYSLGIIYAGFGRYQKAIENYHQAIRLAPDFAAAIYNMGITYFHTGNYQQAARCFKHVTHLAPDFLAAYYNLGVVYQLTGQHQQAIDYYEEAIRLKQDYSDAYNNRASVYLTIGNSLSGCRDAQKACELGQCSTLTNAQARGLCR